MKVYVLVLRNNGFFTARAPGGSEAILVFKHPRDAGVFGMAALRVAQSDAEVLTIEVDLGERSIREALAELVTEPEDRKFESVKIVTEDDLLYSQLVSAVLEADRPETAVGPDPEDASLERWLGGYRDAALFCAEAGLRGSSLPPAVESALSRVEASGPPLNGLAVPLRALVSGRFPADPTSLVAELPVPLRAIVAEVFDTVRVLGRPPASSTPKSAADLMRWLNSTQ